MLNLNKSDLYKLKTLSKALPKDSPRNYGTVINISDGKACITDGFHLLYCTGIIASDSTITKDFISSAIKYPKWSAILPTDNEIKREIDPTEIFKLIKCLNGVNTSDIYLYIDRDMQLSLVSGNGESNWMNAYPGSFFNPSICHKSIRALDKTIMPDSAFVTFERDGVTADKLQINFTNDFHLILVGIRKDKQS